MSSFHPKQRWYALQDRLERAMRDKDVTAVEAALAEARAMRAEAPEWADYVNWLLFVACEYGDQGAVAGLIDAGADLDHHNEQSGPPIAAAVRNGRVETVRFLIASGADLEVVPAYVEGDPIPLTPLMEAVDPDRASLRRRIPGFVQAEIVRLLVVGGADVNAVLPDWTDVEPLEAAPSEEERASYRFVSRVRTAAGEQWVGYDNGVTALSLTSDPLLVRMLLDGGAEPDREPRSRPLFRAIADGRAETVRMLLERGARTDGLSPGRRRSPLREAVAAENLALVEALLEAGAEFHGGEEPADEELSPAMYALLSGK